MPDTVLGVGNGVGLAYHTPSEELPSFQFETYPAESSDGPRGELVRVGTGGGQKKQQTSHQRYCRENPPDDSARRRP